MAANLQDIAEKAGTSLATVSRVLRRDMSFLVSRATRDRVLNVAARLNYRPNRAAKLLQKGKTGAIAVAMSDYAATSWTARQTFALTLRILQGICDTCSGRDYNTALLVPTKANSRKIFEEDILGEQRVDGMILFGDLTFAEYLPKLLKAGIRCVSFWSGAAEYGVPRIVYDTARGLQSVVAAARELGHLRAGCVYHPKLDDRLRVFENSCAARGIALPKTFRVPAMDEAEAYRATLQILRKPDRPSLIFYSSDHLAVAGIKAALDMRLRVPQDLSITGCDDAPYVPADIVPLATVRHPYYEIGQLAARTLLDLIGGEDISAHTISLDCPFIHRASLGKAPQPRRS